MRLVKVKAGLLTQSVSGLLTQAVSGLLTQAVSGLLTQAVAFNVIMDNLCFFQLKAWSLYLHKPEGG